MSSQVQFRRGTTTQNNAFTGAQGELTIDTDVKTIRIHDGTTAGGGSVVVTLNATQSLQNKTLSTGSTWSGNAVALAYGGTGSSLTALAGAIVYSTSSGHAHTTAGSSGQVLQSAGSSAPTWVSTSSLTVGTATTATTATNIAGGSAGQLVIQSDVGTTTFITAGASGTFLKSAGAGVAPTWSAGQVTYGSTTVSLGGTSTSITGLTAVEINGTNGSLGVGTTASGTSGQIRATGSITSYYSDERLKTRSGNIQNALEKVLTLDGFYYTANEIAVELGYDSSVQEVGLSAQQVQAVLPQIVVAAPIDDKYLTIQYERMIPLLVEAIKEQQKQIEELKAKLGN